MIQMKPFSLLQYSSDDLLDDSEDVLVSNSKTKRVDFKLFIFL